MNRSRTVSWQDPRALADAARSMAAIDFLRAIGKSIHIGSRIGTTTCIVLANGK